MPLTAAYAYDTLNRLQTLTPPSAFTSGSFGFSYDALSRRTQMTRPNSITTNYSYDNLSRLLSVLHKSGSTTLDGAIYTVDNAGNRTDQTVTGGSCFTFHVAVNAQNQFSGSPYQYDAAGNLLNDGNHTYEYDAENRIVSVDGGSTASYVYDASGRRARKTVGTDTTDYVYDLSNNKVAIFGPGCGGTGCLQASAVYLNGRFFTQYYAGTTYFRTADHLGSARLLTDVSQNIFDSFDYLPFGEQISGGNGTLLKFTGKERDSEPGLDEFGARYYSSGFGRFTIPDWAANAVAVPYADFGNPQSLNLYSYVKNNPLNIG